jgi:hypothetical protein
MPMASNDENKHGNVSCPAWDMPYPLEFDGQKAAQFVPNRRVSGGRIFGKTLLDVEPYSGIKMPFFPTMIGARK